MSSLKKQAMKQVTEGAAQALCEFLNHPDSLNDDGRAELRKIESLLRTLIELRRRDENGELLLHSDPQMVAVNEILAGYKWVTKLTHAGAGFLYFTRKTAAPIQQHVSHEEFQRYNESGVWQAHTFSDLIVSLSEDSLLDRVRPCGYCGQWFFGTGIYHSQKCKQAAYRSKPEVKKRANEYQKKYYKDVLSPVTGFVAKGRKRSLHTRKKR
jgi:hypothetical protein